MGPPQAGLLGRVQDEQCTVQGAVYLGTVQGLHCRSIVSLTDSLFGSHEGVRGCLRRHRMPVNISRWASPSWAHERRGSEAYAFAWYLCKYLSVSCHRTSTNSRPQVPMRSLLEAHCG